MEIELRSKSRLVSSSTFSLFNYNLLLYTFSHLSKANYTFSSNIEHLFLSFSSLLFFLLLPLSFAYILLDYQLLLPLLLTSDTTPPSLPPFLIILSLCRIEKENDIIKTRPYIFTLKQNRTKRKRAEKNTLEM